MIHILVESRKIEFFSIFLAVLPALEVLVCGASPVEVAPQTFEVSVKLAL